MISFVAILVALLLGALAVALVKLTDQAKAGGALACTAFGFALACSPVAPFLGHLLVALASLANGSN
ncbi:hypothetical protein [Streptomyces sp. NPDC127197]|uniref:hypothetical protein n=1 Tax=Streptomyces sp. NPDC127197 TaxID=3345388 RepID=UPI003637C8AE